ncbi:MAG: exodeoxyribonuclease VII large subunit [Collinsella sp.]
MAWRPGCVRARRRWTALGYGLELAASRLRSKGAQPVERAPVAELGRSAAALDALSPLKVLGRGYSIAYDGGGSVATRADSFHVGDALRLRMADGDVLATVDAVECVAAPRE